MSTKTKPKRKKSLAFSSAGDPFADDPLKDALGNGDGGGASGGGGDGDDDGLGEMGGGIGSEGGEDDWYAQMFSSELATLEQVNAKTFTNFFCRVTMFDLRHARSAQTVHFLPRVSM